MRLEDAEVIYAVREIRVNPAVAKELKPLLKRERLEIVIAQYPCVRNDLVDIFINIFSELWPKEFLCSSL